MLVLLFEVGDGRYALETSHVVEIVPYVLLKKIPMMPNYVAGLINYRGLPVPAIDLSVLLDGRPSEIVLSSRIIIVNDPFRRESSQNLLGLIAPQVTETFKSSNPEPSPTGVLMDDQLYDGSVASDVKGMVQLFDLSRMLPQEELQKLFKFSAEKSG